MWRIGICDDDPGVLEQVGEYIQRYRRFSNVDLCVVAFPSGEALLETGAKGIDILFLDIAMGTTSGMEIAHRLREQGNEVCIVFLTTMVQYALEGYDVRAFAFLTKPTTYEIFAGKLASAIRYCKERNGVVLSLKNGAQTDRVNTKDIIYVEVMNHSVSIVGNGFRNTYYMALSDVEEVLEKAGFFRCHKSFMVNLKKIQSICSRDLTMMNGDVIPVSRYRKEQLMLALAACSRRGF